MKSVDSNSDVAFDCMMSDVNLDAEENCENENDLGSDDLNFPSVTDKFEIHDQPEVESVVYESDSESDQFENWFGVQTRFGLYAYVM